MTDVRLKVPFDIHRRVKILALSSGLTIPKVYTGVLYLLFSSNTDSRLLAYLREYYKLLPFSEGEGETPGIDIRG